MKAPQQDVAAAIGPGADPAAEQALADAHRQMLQDRTLQFEMQELVPPDFNPPRWLEGIGDFFRAIAPFLEWIFWGGVALGVMLLAYVIISEVIRRWPSRRAATATTEAPAPKPEYRPAASRARALLEEADRLAAEGRYGEAARVLLHRSIEDIEKTFSMIVGPGLTSREISMLEPLSPQGRSVFTGIARAVELSFFGQRPLASDDYARCREAYAGFALQGARR